MLEVPQPSYKHGHTILTLTPPARGATRMRRCKRLSSVHGPRLYGGCVSTWGHRTPGWHRALSRPLHSSWRLVPSSQPWLYELRPLQGARPAPCRWCHCGPGKADQALEDDVIVSPLKPGEPLLLPHGARVCERPHRDRCGTPPQRYQSDGRRVAPALHRAPSRMASPRAPARRALTGSP